MRELTHILALVQPRSFELNPAINPWLLGVGAITAIVAVRYLYKAQRTIASSAIVNTLMGIRILLVLLVIAMLLGPVRQWVHTRHSTGTLFVLLDQSGSMRQKDLQSTDLETLAWADALGYLPNDLQPSSLPLDVSRLNALADELDQLRAQPDRLPERLSAWKQNLNDIAASLASNARVKQSAPEVPGTFQTIAADIGKTSIAWQQLRDALGRPIARLAPLGDADARDFLDRHRNDSRVVEALAKVRQHNRAELAASALTSKSAHQLKGLADLASTQDLKLIPFGDHNSINTPEKADLPAAIKSALADPDGKNTDIASALRFVSEQAGDDSTIVVVSDGRQNTGAAPQPAAAALAARGIPVFTLTVGSHQPVRDAAVDHIDAPDWVYSGDQVVITPVVKFDQLQGQTVTVELHRGSELVDTKQIKVQTNQDKLRLKLTDRPPREGVYNYSVVIPPVPNEAVSDNNSQTVQVAVKKDRLNILLIEDDPGWEYQFLRNYLVRDHRVKLQVVLANPARIENIQSPQGITASPANPEAKVDAQLLPTTKDKWAGFDLVIIGDLSPEKLPPAQQTNLTAALEDGSIKALLLLAGPRNMPSRYAAEVLGKIIPVELSGSPWTAEQLQDQQRHGFVPMLAPDGLNSILGQFSEDFGTNTALWANLPLWYWHSDWTAAKPAASVIWSLSDAASAETKKPSADDEYESTRRRALLATMNVGLGRVMYLASPQTWRLRYVQTPGDDSHIEDVHRRFWGQVIRWAMGTDLPAGGKFVKFGANKHTYLGGEPILLTARVLNADRSPLADDAFKMVAIGKDGVQVGQTAMTPTPSEGAGVYRGSMTLSAGSYTLAVKDGKAAQLLDSDSSVDTSQKTLKIEVTADATVEDHDVNTDPETMTAIAAAGSGISTDGCRFDVLAEHLPVVDRTETQIVQAGLFSDPKDPRTQIAHWLFFGLFVTLITAEWILRKRGGLV
jgi:hypothetical protein